MSRLLRDDDVVTAGSVIFVTLMFWLLVTIPMAFWTDSNLDFWLSYFKGEGVNVPFFLSWVATAFTAVFGIVGNVIMSILRLAV